MLRWLSLIVLGMCCVSPWSFGDETALRLATFDVDATPPVGSPVAYAAVKSIADPLHAKGVVLLPADEPPIVLCAFDWIGIANGGQDWWREALAAAAGTSLDRVAVHTVHQHDGPRCDATAIALLAKPAWISPHFDEAFHRRVGNDVVHAVSEAIARAQPVTHVGIGRARVEKVASNRRLLGSDGKVAKMRFSSCRDEQAIAAPEGVIDPWVRLVSWWHEDQPLACLAYYATHPMSHYGKGDVSADFVGLARQQREQQTGVLHVYFTGAAGNVAAGKYNNGDPEVRPVLATRLSEAMSQAWQQTTKSRISVGDVGWRTESVHLPAAAHLNADDLQATVSDAETSEEDRLAAASHLAWLSRCDAGTPVHISCLRVGPAWIVHMPGELFVEYALAAQQLRPRDFVCMAAYGDYGPGYIGTEEAYAQGGYETSPGASRVSSQADAVLRQTLRRLLQ